MKRVLLSFALTVLGASVAAAQAGVTKDKVEGITNLSRVGTTVACAGAVTPAAVAGIKKMGFASIINLRMPNEPGNDLAAEEAAAKAAGIKFVNIPMNSTMPEAASADRFLRVIAEPSSEPAFIHCASGNRASAVWLIKRVVIDKWDLAKAQEEATALGLTSPVLKQFAADYIQAHSK
ncbi:MAG: hypothetical protein EXQ47_01960 [Bryobacterales bacterium]|nr:hypothetical protein [Bryobacterales bacterium]